MTEKKELRGRPSDPSNVDIVIRTKGYTSTVLRYSHTPYKSILTENPIPKVLRICDVLIFIAIGRILLY